MAHCLLSFVYLTVWGVEPVVTHQTSWLEHATLPLVWLAVTAVCSNQKTREKKSLCFSAIITGPPEAAARSVAVKGDVHCKTAVLLQEGVGHNACYLTCLASPAYTHRPKVCHKE